MDKEHRRDGNPVVDSDSALSPLLDQSRLQTERRAATDRLLARLKALDGAHAAQTPRAYAQRYVRQQEALIVGLLNAGVGTEEILTDLALAFSSIPTPEFRHAIAQLRDRQRKQIGATTSARPASAPPPGASDKAPSGPAASPPPAPDRRADESNEDYRLRKALEGPPDQSRQFIGEH